MLSLTLFTQCELENLGFDESQYGLLVMNAFSGQMKILVKKLKKKH